MLLNVLDGLYLYLDIASSEEFETKMHTCTAERWELESPGLLFPAST